MANPLPHPEYLLTAYPELDLALPDSAGDSPLHLAAYNGHLGTASWQLRSNSWGGCGTNTGNATYRGFKAGQSMPKDINKCVKTYDYQC